MQRTRAGWCVEGLHDRCAGFVENGSKAPNPVFICKCECHTTGRKASEQPRKYKRPKRK